ncbi:MULTISPECIES: DUF802 domain-containing protein [Stenotrophomonas]|uniref:Membrane protein n=1 Tax=Stenotrophomonas nitritireducens TaxID=83617 RepID=A0ABR5NHJ0_9GAMM|nr:MULTISPECIES: DUF802 domain-containing protein [Stenotrophomonas]KQN97973.1 hypothetical protein ASF01_08760 [Stenotrophomonas sp. Leaf70]KRG55675.1 membrane protein [Stenotrophomonas nitritireducens]
MSRTFIAPVVFLAGLLAVCWIGIGYLGSHPLAAAVAALIATCYLVGAVELLRYRQATATLVQALPSLGEAAGNLDGWLSRLQPGLRSGVRLRIIGERVGLPAPALTPYLVGLLVLLGMLGTLLGMMATLRGTGLALESASDLDAIRSSLAAPVKGLSFAFGTSIAGVATSAALGLLSALLRRERAQAVQQLDAGIAAQLGHLSPSAQQRETFRLLQEQNALMPALVDRLQALAGTLERQQHDAGQRLQSSQQEFHQRSEAAWTQLAASLQQALREGIAQQANAVGAALQPVVDTTMAGLAGKSAQLQAAIEQAVRTQLDGLDSAVQGAASAARDSWNAAVAEQQRGNTALADGLQQALQQFAGTFEQRSAALVDGVAARLEDSTARTAETWNSALVRQHEAHEALAQRNELALVAASARFDQHARTLVDTLQQSHGELQSALAARDEQRLAQWSQSLAAMLATLDESWQRNGAQVAQQQQQVCDALARTAGDVAAQLQAAAGGALDGIAGNAQALTEAAATFAQRSDAMIEALHRTHGELQDALQARDAERLAQWRDAFAQLTGEFGQRWEHSSAQVAAQQQQVCDTLAQTTQAIHAQAQAQARDTLAEIERLVATASEAPRAAAEVVAELRQKLSDSMVRDTATLEERGRLLETVQTLLDAVNHASTEQRGAIDALVSTSAELLERVGSRFTAQVESEAGKLDDAAAHVTGSALEVASLGEAFGGAVQAFGQSTETLNERLQGIESALEKSLARSDEQLAYYVAQAREVIELSMLSQKQIIGELQQLAGARDGAGAA